MIGRIILWWWRSIPLASASTVDQLMRDLHVGDVLNANKWEWIIGTKWMRTGSRKWNSLAIGVKMNTHREGVIWQRRNMLCLRGISKLVDRSATWKRPLLVMITASIWNENSSSNAPYIDEPNCICWYVLYANTREEWLCNVKIKVLNDLLNCVLLREND